MHCITLSFFILIIFREISLHMFHSPFAPLCETIKAFVVLFSCDYLHLFFNLRFMVKVSVMEGHHLSFVLAICIIFIYLLGKKH